MEFETRYWKSLGSCPCVSAALFGFFCFFCFLLVWMGRKIQAEKNRLVCLAFRTNEQESMYCEWRERILEHGDETRDKEHLVYLPHADSAVSRIHKFICFTAVSNTHICVCVRACLCAQEFTVVTLNRLRCICLWVQVCTYTQVPIQNRRRGSVRVCASIHHQNHPKCCLGNKLTEVNECPGSAEGLWESNMPAFRPISLTDSLFGL